ncbi:hypothetical protein [Colwellia sp. MB02u-14]|uniref:hypothetical protein n=1 Tax=Colwellia sp. MB02u-14 TaxID=2759815 RepID=UPI0015F5ACCD|nr:hypothetical protein [Colwellia sp. MB02u-14]MBA6304950.1 hypothetical protein [Colwellia sp. MB02u-14]
MQDEIKQNRDKDTYQNPFTPSKNQRKKLTLPISELLKLDEDETFKITFCCLLAQHLQENKGLRELLNEVAAYVIDPEKDFLTKSAGFFEHKDNKIFFRERHSSILIGFLSETEYISRFAEYQYYSLEAVKDF